MAPSIGRIEVLLLVAAVVSMLSRRMHLPYTVGLLVAGIAVALAGIGAGIDLTPEFIFTALLPPLVFEAAYQMPWKALRADLAVIATMATVGVVLAAAATAVGKHWLGGWDWWTAVLFGVLVSATDPVSVIAMLKENPVGNRLRLLVEAESLLNDGTAAVLFGTVLTAATIGSAIQPSRVVISLTTTVLGGIACGAMVGWAMLAVAGRTHDHLVEITFTTVAAYGSFLLAEHYHLSGVLAVMTAGLLVGNVGFLGAISPRGREAVVSFWEYAAFVANSLAFLLIGMRLTKQEFVKTAVVMGLAILVVVSGRALAVYTSCGLFRWTHHRVTGRDQHILVWGGLRGALALALALGIPADVHGRDVIVAVTFGVVAFSVIVQGMTIGSLLRAWSGSVTPSEGEAA